jgi:hypothetical protein
MSTITTRAGKGSPLTNTEMDNNLTNLNTDKLQSGDTAASLTITSATINGGTITGITDLAVADGGTGLSSLTAGYIPYGAGTSAFGSSANLFWDSANDRLGIGTATPTSLLEIYNSTSSQLLIAGDSTANLIIERDSADIQPSALNFRKGRGTYASKSAVASGDIVGQSNYSAYGGSNFRAIAQIRGVVDTYTSDTNISGYLTFSTNVGSTGVTEHMRIDSAGNVGIGTTSTSSKLEVYGSVVNTMSNAGTEDASTVTITNADVTSTGRIAKTLYQIGNLSLASVSGVYTTFNATNDIGGALAFSTQSTAAGGVLERMRVDKDGNVGIGTTNPASAGKFQVQGVSGTPIINYTDGTVIGTAGYITGSVAYSGSRSNHSIGFLTNDAERARILSTGQLLVSGGSTTQLVSIPGSVGNSTIYSRLGMTVVNDTTTLGYFQTYNSNAGTDLKTWRHGGQTDGSYIFATVNDAYSSTTTEASISATGVISDIKGDVRAAPQNPQTTGYTTVAADAGKHVQVTGNVAIGVSVHSTGDMITIFNNTAGNITITTTSTTVYFAGSAATGNRTLAQRGLATILCVGTNTFAISGAGLT